jgi:hypothetical protein
MIQDDLIVKLGQSQQRVMSLSVRCRHLEIAEQRARERAEILEELVMDVVADLHEGVSASKIDYRIGKVMQKLEWDEDG